MTINSTTRSVSYEGNGTVSSFDFAFKVFQSSDLYVVSLNESTGVETTLVLNTNYTVALNADQNYSPGGTITITAGAPASGTRITITSTIANLQPTDLSNQGGFYPDVINNSLDRACIQIQQVNNAISRQLVAPVSDGTTTTLTLPTKENRASKYLAFDASGAPTASSGTVNPVVSAGGSVTLQPNNAGSNVGRDVIVQDYNTEYARFVGASRKLQLTGTSALQGTASDGTVTQVFAYPNATVANFGTSSNHPVGVLVNNAAVATFATSGNVGVGTSSPASLFHAHNTASADTQIRLTNGATGATVSDGVALRVDSSGAAYVFNYEGTSLIFGTSATERMRIKSDGEVLIAGTTDQGAYNLQCNGTGVWGAGAYVNGSDSRIKNSITPLDSCLDRVNAIQPVTFKYNADWCADQTVQTGFIAQQLQQALAGTDYIDGIVSQGGEYLNVAYQNIIPLLTKSIQELTAMVQSQAARIAALETR